MSSNQVQTDAEVQFGTSSIYPTPQGFTAWKIRNDYPVPSLTAQGIDVITTPGQLPPGEDPTPWLQVDFRAEPVKYLELVKEYFLEGMIESDFVPHNNQIRQWYHAPWMHYGSNGREPIRGLTAELATPPQSLSKGQTDYFANWGAAFFNAQAATVLGQVWVDPNNPQANGIKFPERSVIIKALFTTAPDDQLPSMKGAPKWDAVVANKPDRSQPRNKHASSVRLLQLDIAVTDPNAPLGWIFGSFWYNGFGLKDDHEDEPVRDKWNRLMPVGLAWGNDPELTQAAYEAGRRPQEGWINPDAKKLLADMGGKRPSLGWNDRMNGPADNFISSCLSCHSVAQVNAPPPEPTIYPKPSPVEGPPGVWKPVDDSVTMKWFRNIPCAVPFTEGATSTDYNLQVRGGLKNYYEWRRETGKLTEEEERFGGSPRDDFPRGGPDIQFL